MKHRPALDQFLYLSCVLFLLSFQSFNKIYFMKKSTNRLLKILVIGSKGHRGATRCVDWRAPFPNIADFDVVIINLQTLDKDTLKAICDRTRQEGRYNVVDNRLSKMRDDIFELTRSRGQVYCILNRFLSSENVAVLSDGTSEPVYHNLQWCPVGFRLIETKPGDTKEDVNPNFRDYINHIKEWQYYIA